MGPLLPRGGVQESCSYYWIRVWPWAGAGQYWGHRGLFSSLVWGQAAPRSAGFRSEQGQDYFGLKDAKKLLDKTTTGAGPQSWGKRMYVMAPATSVGSAAALALILPQPQKDKTKSNKEAV